MQVRDLVTQLVSLDQQADVGFVICREVEPGVKEKTLYVLEQLEDVSDAYKFGWPRIQVMLRRGRYGE